MNTRLGRRRSHAIAIVMVIGLTGWLGSTTVSAADLTAPNVTMTAPVTGGYVRGTSVALAATATDDTGVTGVQFLLDGTINVGARDTSSPYARTWSTSGVADGPHTLAARASDAANNTSTSTISVIVDNQAPSGTVVVNSGATATNSRSSTLTLSASDALGAVSQMRFSNTGSSFSGTQAYSTTATWSLSAGTGTKTVYVQFRDLAGNWSSVVSADTIVLDTTAPTISGRSVSGLSHSGATITWITDEPSSSRVDYGLTTAYGTSSALDSGLTTSHVVQLTGLEASTTYNYDVRSRDAAGNERVSGNLTFTTTNGPADVIAPLVDITAPVEGAQVVDITAVTAGATDNVAVVGVQFLVDGAKSGVEDTAAPFVFDWDTRTTTNGAHTVSARARDAAGNSATSSVVTVNVTNTNFFQNEVLITGLDLPTNIEFLPDGRMLIAQLGGRILRRGTSVHVGQPDSVRRDREHRHSGSTRDHGPCARSRLRQQPLLLRLLHSWHAQSRPAVEIHRQRDAHWHTSEQRIDPVRGSPGRARRAPRGCREFRERRQAVFHHG